LLLSGAIIAWLRSISSVLSVEIRWRVFTAAVWDAFSTGAIVALTDRRRVTRFEFVENQWGSVQTLEPLNVRNVAQEGLLIESPTPMPVGSQHVIRLVHKESTAQCHVAVRHLSPRKDAEPSNGQRFLIGLEFVNLDDHATALVRDILAPPASSPLRNEA
jgi:hypothetical protein